MQRFADVSHYEGNPDWSVYAASKRGDLAACEATKGTEFVDPTFQKDRVDLSNLGLYFGLYHFAGTPAKDTIADPITEADAYLKAVGPLGPREFPILDFEYTYGMKPQQQIDWMTKWLAYVQQKTGKTPWVYSYHNFLAALQPTGLQGLTKYPLWEADYVENADPTKPPDTFGWPQLTAWQYTDHQTVPGVAAKCDDNFLYKDVALQLAYDRAEQRFGAIPGVQISVSSSDASGGRPIVVLKNARADANNLTVQTHFHGDQLYDQQVDYEKHIGDTVAAAWQKDANTVFVLPDDDNEDVAPRSDWNNIKSVSGLTRQAVDAAGIAWAGVKHTVLSGHSAGGSVVALSIARGDTDFSRIELYDCAVGSLHNPVSDDQRKVVEAYCKTHESQFVLVPGILKGDWLDYIDKSRWTAPHSDHWTPLWDSLGQSPSPAA